MRTKLCLVTLAAVGLLAAAAPNLVLSAILPLKCPLEVSVPANVPQEAVSRAALTSPEVEVTRHLVGRVRHRPDPYPPQPYHPRVSRQRAPVMPLAAQAHVGFLDPIDNFSTGINGGFRVGPQVDPHIQVGVAMDWWHRSENEVLDLGPIDAPGGTAEQELILSESSANLVPMMVFAQVSLDDNLPVVPYAGFGLGYEWLFLTANNYLTDERFDQTFGGLGWQAWVGAGVPLDMGMRLNGEFFFNACEVGSEVEMNVKDYGPATVRNVIQMNSFGMRVGVSWGF